MARRTLRLTLRSGAVQGRADAGMNHEVGNLIHRRRVATELIVVADAVHFFHGKLLELRAAVLEFLRQDAGDS